MLPTSSLILLLASIFLYVAAAQLLGLERGSKCRGGTCRGLNECPTAGNFKKNRPELCSFQGRTPIICCPSSPTPTTSATTTTSTTTPLPPTTTEVIKDDDFGIKAARKCFQYNLETCPRLTQFVKRDLIPVVVGGKKTKPKELPFMALIGFGPVREQSWDCGGSLISERWVLSAAHCEEHPQKGKARWVRLGELELETDHDDARPLDLLITRSAVHPNYKSTALYNDIALFEMERGVIFSSYIKPICLDTISPLQGSPTAAGWGTTDFGGGRSAYLLKVELDLISTEFCRVQYNRSRDIPSGLDPSTQICAAAPGRDTCTGDSGGPLFFDMQFECLKRQIGVTSFGRRCALLPGVYTKIHHYIPWIEEIVWPDNVRTTTPTTVFDLFV